MADVATLFGDACMDKYNMPDSWEAFGYKRRGEIVIKTKDDNGKTVQFRNLKEASKLFNSAETRSLFPKDFALDTIENLLHELKEINAERRGVPLPSAAASGEDKPTPEKKSPAAPAKPQSTGSGGSISGDEAKGGGSPGAGSSGRKRKVVPALPSSAAAALETASGGKRAKPSAAAAAAEADAVQVIRDFLSDPQDGRPQLSLADAERTARALSRFAAPRVLGLLAENIKVNAEEGAE